MKYITLFSLALILLLFILFWSLKNKKHIKDFNSQDVYAKGSTFRYYFILILLIAALICALYAQLMNFTIND
ncbi:hypothetical protein EOD40_04130 [Flavobacterium sufflavum]|uniref:Uncharacterized protein n=1 Tax=Flavobacterium sufflavum TaxID=1921138 RepID=A0A3S2ULN2_9FLAO|nr:hypothetical protein [Flavobacterium sufflavum]RVT78431.1 hypothetical protein EOD40_04130 [Flavobacterium sufflavum]